MAWIGAAIGAVGGLLSSRSQSKAGDVQAEAARHAADQTLTASREGNQLIGAGIRQGLLTQAPAYYSGNVALSSLMGAMGLGPSRVQQTTPGGGPVNAPSGDVQGGGAPTYTNAQGQTVDASGKVVDTTDRTYGIGDIYYGPTNEELTTAAGTHENALTGDFTEEDLLTDPSYKFRLEEGERLLRARQGAGGNRWSGQAMKDITNYGQGAASQEFGAAHERWRNNRTDLYNRLSNLAGLGPGAASNMNATTTAGTNNMASNLTNAATTAGNFTTGGAAATAGGITGSTNALVGGVNSGLNNYMTMQYLRGNQGGGGGGSNIWSPGYDDVNASSGGWTGSH